MDKALSVAELTVLYFFAYSVIGWVCETVYCSIGERRFVKRGFLTGPYCPIYGFGGVVIQFFMAQYTVDAIGLSAAGDFQGIVKGVFTTFCAGMVLTSAIEYFTSWAMEKLFHAKWWDYSNRSFNLNGRICLLNSVLFGVMSVVLVYAVQPGLGNLFLGMTQPAMGWASLAIVVIMAADTAHSTVETVNMRSKTGQYMQIKQKATEALDMAAVRAGDLFRERVEEFKAHRDELSAETRARIESFLAELEKLDKDTFTQRRIKNAFPQLREYIEERMHGDDRKKGR